MITHVRTQFAEESYAITGEKTFLKKEITVFLILAMLISWPLILILIGRITPEFQMGDVKSTEALFGNIPMLFGLGPFVSALIVTTIYRGGTGLKALFRKVIEWRVSIQWYILALLLPVIPQWIGLFVWQALTGLDATIPAFTMYLSSWLQITLISAVYYISEELGWRGFMLPRFLATDNWIKSASVVGIFWSLWHYPLWFTSSWMTTGSYREATLMVTASTIFTIGISVIITWIFKNTKGSVLLAMILHGANQANLSKMYAAAGEGALSTSTFIIVQAVTLLVFVLIVVYVIRKQNKYF